ncbi:MAG: LysR family transcriptional regulator [Alphaproteobacteria bacterium]|nr:LysR family transcriptional regulator [Alphaproteobacteria bacterium]
MDARVLEYFLRVVELGSINRAAIELGLSQPSLSRWLTMLEHDIGSPLLIRTRKGVHPTDAGQQLAERAQPILRQLDLLRDEVGQGAVSQVALAMPYSVRVPVTAPFVGQLATDTPHITLRLHEGMSNTIRALIEDGLVDVAVMAATEHTPESYDSTPLFSESLYLVGPADAGLRRDMAVAGPDLGEVDMILPGRPNVIRAQVEGAIAGAGGTYRSRFDTDSIALCLELTRRNLGFTVMPESALGEPDSAGTGLSAAPIEGLELTWTLCTNRARNHSVAVRTVSERLRRFAAERCANPVARN